MSPKTRQSAECCLRDGLNPETPTTYVSYAAAVKEGSTKSKESRQSGEISLTRQPQPRNPHVSYTTVVKDGSSNNRREESRRSYAAVARSSSKTPKRPAPIYMLPDELLVLICEICESLYTPDDEGFAFSVHIAQVSRRFRAVAFSTSRLWSTVSSTQRPEELKAFLERSGAAQLTIVIHLECHRPFSK